MKRSMGEVLPGERLKHVLCSKPGRGIEVRRRTQEKNERICRLIRRTMR